MYGLVASRIVGWREHRRAARYLPWLVNGTIDGAERRRLERHLAECEPCRKELDAERRLAETMALRPAAEVSPHPARVRAVLARIEATEAKRRHGWPRSLLPDAVAVPRGVWLVVGIQALAVAVIGTLLLVERWTARVDPAARFHTLSEPAPAVPAGTPRLRVVFGPSVSAGEMRSLLESVGGRIVDGPSGLGVYTVELPRGSGEDDLTSAVERLRRRPEIRFVEPQAPAR